MKLIISIIGLTFLIGCAPLSHVKQRDLQIIELRGELDRYKVSSGIILKTCTLNFNREHARYTSASDNRDRWFLEYTTQTRYVDTLYMQINDLEEELNKCSN